MEKAILNHGKTMAEILPEQGAVVSKLIIGGKNILFPQTILSTPGGQKRRGGLPLLFPNAGPLSDNNQFKLPQHGFARNLAWSTTNQTKNSASFNLFSNPQTKEKYPFDFELYLNILVQNQSFNYLLTITNKTAASMPIAPGLHPYFNVQNDKKKQIKTNIPNLNLEKYTEGETLFLPNQEIIKLNIPSIGEVKVKSSCEFKTLAIWSEPNRDFICFEPWIGETNALLDKNKRIEIPPKNKLNLQLEISLSSCRYPDN